MDLFLPRILYNILNTCITVTWKFPQNPFCRRIKEYYMDNSMYPFWPEMFQGCFLYVNEYYMEISMDQFDEALSY